MFRFTRGALVALVSMTVTVAPCMPAVANDRPAYGTVRDDEDWSFLRDPSKRTDPLDAIKYIPLGQNPADYVTLGGEFREFYEHYFNRDWNPATGSNGYVLARYLLSADAHVGRFRAYTELESATAYGRRGGPGPNDKDSLDASEAFVQTNIGGSSSAFAPPFALQAGRFEFDYGSGRVFSANDGPGIRSFFDGVRAIIRSGHYRIDAFDVNTVTNKKGAFDDSTNHGNSIVGFYASTAPTGSTLDVYAFDDYRKSFTYQRGTAAETRYTVGTRVGRSFGPVDTDLEGAYQFGTFGKDSIAAYSIAGEIGYRIVGRPGTARFSLAGGVGSGDRGTTGALTAFRPPTFKGQYLGAIGEAGPINSVGIEPGFLGISGPVTVTAAYLALARQSPDDAVYNISGRELVRGTPDREVALGSGPLASITYRFDRHASLQGIYQRLSAGAFLNGTPTDTPISYYRTVLDYKF